MKGEFVMLSKFISSLKQEFGGYNAAALTKDLMAGLTVAAVALPLALAFGVSSGAWRTCYMGHDYRHGAYNCRRVLVGKAIKPRSFS